MRLPSLLFMGIVSAHFALAGCGARTGLGVAQPCATLGQERPCSSLCGTGVETCHDGLWSGCTAPKPRDPPASVTLAGTIRDLRDSHPDFEREVGDDRGIVRATLGPDRTPVYAHPQGTTTTHGSAAFRSWFHDEPGVNATTSYELELHRDASGVYRFDSDAFFPIDGLLFGNEGRAHDYHFTFELHTTFRPHGGEVLAFAGDDDIWVFIDDRLVLDLGGVHSSESAQVSLDALGLPRDRDVALDVFYAERHTSLSTLHVEAPLDFKPCD